MLEPYREISVPSGYPPDYTLLATTKPTGEDSEKFPYLRDWPAKFDFALIVDSDGAVDMSAMLSDDADLSKLLRVVVRTDFATLLRVCRPAPCS